MKIKELIKELQDWDSETEVKIEIRGEELEDGDILVIEDADSSLYVTLGELHIIGDLPDD